MSRGKLKFEWSVYSARRKVSLKMLIEKGIARDYESYVSYCEEMSVVPMTKDAYSNELGITESLTSESVPVEDLSPTETPVQEDSGLVATVWFAGVQDDAPLEVTSSKSKKKQKESL